MAKRESKFLVSIFKCGAFPIMFITKNRKDLHFYSAFPHAFQICLGNTFQICVKNNMIVYCFT